MLEEDLKTFVDKIAEAEAIVVGGASGMSVAAGYNCYEKNDLFLKYFENFARAYGIDSIFGGFYYRFSTHEERWAYIATLVKFVLDSPVGQAYLDLREILEGKNYFILTTNQDRQFSNTFPEEKVSTIQGDWSYWQCSLPCHDHVYPNQEIVENQLYPSIKETKIPSELVPTCPKCGETMEPWVRSRVFLEGTRYQQQYEKYYAFLEENINKKILFLELGVGRMTPMFIQEPFWTLTYSLPDAYYITVNPNHAIVPEKLQNKGLAISEDIAKVLAGALKVSSRKTSKAL